MYTLTLITRLGNLYTVTMPGCGAAITLWMALDDVPWVKARLWRHGKLLG